jgi:four helix bundle protein
MSEIQDKNNYDLEARTLKFARDIRNFIRKLPRTISNIEDSKQLVRSSGSIGANYIEANEALSKKDFSMRIKISRKEAKESCFWISLVYVENNSELEDEREKLLDESRQLTKIFGSIVEKSK